MVTRTRGHRIPLLRDGVHNFTLVTKMKRYMDEQTETRIMDENIEITKIGEEISMRRLRKQLWIK